MDSGGWTNPESIGKLFINHHKSNNYNLSILVCGLEL